ncbi:piggyBac transposable element-derived protein 4 [Gymnodraco acuticeps]|uniref:PiggyBac transposable element-derived protein 4 n=1 Tax=Gymnodraco acuticeps TaxID=8218 RepID=A0A6P8VIV9_GYMAC|nr:piggyBac transposable element-derived protein 4 [Gymnodraco acuticeps]
MSKRRYTTEEAIAFILSGGPLSDAAVDSSDSEADSWRDEEEYDHGIDPFEDKNPEDEREDAQATVPISRPPSNREGKECGQEGAASRKKAKPMPAPLTVKGRGRGKGKKTSLTPEEPGAVWNGPEVPDTAQQLPHFCLKRAPGVQGFVGVEYTPAQIFRHFFNNQAVNIICKNTNKNAEKEQAKGKKFVWEELKPVKFLMYVGLMMFMALLKLPKVRDYWRKGSHLSVLFPASVMTRDRFMAISRAVHLSDPDHDLANDRKKDTPEYDPLHRLKPLQATIKEACKAMWQPRKEISIDERMVATKAKIGLRQYMKAKPTKWGVKLFVLADSSNGYTIDFSIYTGKSRFISGQGLSYDVVSGLMDNSYLGRGYHLFVDNFYTSPKLFTDLFARGFVACGTFRDNRKNVPKSKLNALTSKSPRGSMRWLREKELLFVKWMDTREVSVCSTIHQAFNGDTVTRNVYAKETGKWQKQNMAPRCVVEYNKYMGGVDLSDQLIQYYSVHKRSNRWYRTLLYHFIDIAATNSYILHKEMCLSSGSVAMSHAQFMEELSAELCGVPIGSFVPPTGAQCLPESMSCAEEEEGIDSFARRRSGDTATKEIASASGIAAARSSWSKLFQTELSTFKLRSYALDVSRLAISQGAATVGVYVKCARSNILPVCMKSVQIKKDTKKYLNQHNKKKEPQRLLPTE